LKGIDGREDVKELEKDYIWTEGKEFGSEQVKATCNRGCK
jgi:hypothetical protein